MCDGMFMYIPVLSCSLHYLDISQCSGGCKVVVVPTYARGEYCCGHSQNPA